MSNKRIIFLDVIRIIACLMIILMHSPFKDVDHSSIIISSISYFTAPAIGLFFMVSGALLLENTLSTGHFLKRRFSKIIWPTLIFTILDIFLAVWKQHIPLENVPKMLLSTPITAQGWYGTLWFMYTIAGLYLLTPILSRWAQSASKREIEFYLIIWAITLFFPILSNCVIVDTSINGMLYHFQGAVGYFILGYYINRHLVITKKVKLLIIFAAIICVLTPIIYKFFIAGIDFYKYFWYYSPTAATMAIIIFIVVKSIISTDISNRRIREFVILTSNYAFGIYLVHIFIMRDIIRNIDFFHNIGSIGQISTTTLLTFIISWLFCWIINKTPMSKYILGINKNNK